MDIALLELHQKWIAEFEDLRLKQWEKGREHYGETFYLTGLNNNQLFTMIYEELADVSNYAAMLHGKLRALQEFLQQGGFIQIGEEDEVHSDSTSKSA